MLAGDMNVDCGSTPRAIKSKSQKSVGSNNDAEDSSDVIEISA
jgi:hypothetical protein